jgi:energy-converting hydrogenase Eha subunit E
MFHSVLPMVLLNLRRQHGGKENLDQMKLVSKTACRIGRETELQSDGTEKFFVKELRNLMTSTKPACTRTLQSLAKEFEHDCDVQHQILFVMMECIATIHGENWKDLGNFHPLNTRLVKSPLLSAALMAGQRRFTPTEWAQFDIHFLEQIHCEQVGDTFFQVDVSTLNPITRMAPVDTLHTIVLDAMHMHGHNLNILVMALFLLECFHLPPWLSTFRQDTYPGQAIRAMKMVVAAMMNFANNIEIQKSAFKACAHLCHSLRPGATYKVHVNGGNDVMHAVLTTMRNFPMCNELQLNGADMIILNSCTVPGAPPLSPMIVQYHNSIFKGIGLTLIKLCVERCNPTLTVLTCNALRALFRTKIVIMTEMEKYVSFFLWIFMEWDQVNDRHLAMCDKAATALVTYFQAKDEPPFTKLESAQHRDSLRKLINAHDMNQLKPGIMQTEWLGQRILSYMCPYSNIPMIRDKTDRFCRFILLLCEMCQDNNESREKFIYNSNGINMCLLTTRYFVERGSEDDMDVAVHVVDLLKSLYTQIYCQLEPNVSLVVLQTAHAARFASSHLAEIALHRLSNTAEPYSNMPLLSVHAGVNMISALQDIMRVPGVEQILLQSCMEVLAGVAVLPENSRCIDTKLIYNIFDAPTDTSRRLLEDKAIEVLTQCHKHLEVDSVDGHAASP